MVSNINHLCTHPYTGVILEQLQNLLAETEAAIEETPDDDTLLSQRTFFENQVVGLRNRGSDWSTRVHHKTIVYQYRSCTQCRCIVPVHYTHSVTR